MARQTKPGIDYFSHDVDMLQDKKVKIIKAKHGLIGYAVYLRLLEELYRENGYYLQIDEDFNILFADDNNLDFNVYILILNDCIGKNLFDKETYEKHSILTSSRIQKNYCAATERRKEVAFIKEYLLIDTSEFFNTEKVNVNIESLNVDINSLNVDIGTQSKVKESKGKESKGKEHPSCTRLQSVIDSWNQLPVGNLKSVNPNTNRYKMLGARIKEHGMDEVINAIESINRSSFLKGQNNRNWIITFDWFIKPNNFIKVLEGNYLEENKGGMKHEPNGTSVSINDESEETKRFKEEEYRKAEELAKDGEIRFGYIPF